MAPVRDEPGAATEAAGRGRDDSSASSLGGADSGATGDVGAAAISSRLIGDESELFTSEGVQAGMISADSIAKNKHLFNRSNANHYQQNRFSSKY